MKRSSHCAAFAVGLLSATVGLAQPNRQHATIGKLHVKEIQIVEVDTSHVKVSVDMSLIPAQSVTLGQMQLCSLRLNDQPVFAEPLKEELVLQKDVPVDLPPVYVTTLFRDVSTIKPLRRMIEDQSVHVQGELVASLRLTFLEKLALHTGHPKAEIALDQDVPTTVGGAPFEREALLAILAMVDTGLNAKARVGRYLPLNQPGWIHDLKIKAQSNLLDVNSSYILQQYGARYPIVLDQLGFRITSGAVVTTAEAYAPWKYDADSLNAMKSGESKLAKNSQQIELRSLGENGETLELSKGDFAIEIRGTPEEDQVDSTGSGHHQIEVLRRASPASFTLMAPRTLPLQPGLTVAPASVLSQDSWDQVAVFRLHVDAVTNERSFEVLQLGAQRDGNSIRLTEPVDSAVFGSPILTPDGAIGIVQDERAGAFLPVDLVPAVNGSSASK